MGFWVPPSRGTLGPGSHMISCAGPLVSSKRDWREGKGDCLEEEASQWVLRKSWSCPIEGLAGEVWWGRLLSKKQVPNVSVA